MRFSYAAAAFAAVCACAPGAWAQHPIASIQVAGVKRLPAAAVIAASGLRVGQMATRAQLDAAAQKLADTGFFSSVTYGYVPQPAGGVSGYGLTFHVTEQTALKPVELDFPGIDAETLWPQLKAASGLVDRQMPDNEMATAYYKRVIEEVLKKQNHAQEIVLKTELDTATGHVTVVCRPANAPRIAAVRFEGNQAIGSGSLQAAMKRVAIGQDYSERAFRKMLALNITPMYEEMGRLTVSYTRVSYEGAGDVTVTAAIDEGPVWQLGKVIFTGDHLPLADLYEAATFAHGRAADWKQFMMTLEKTEKVLKRDGYLRVHSEAKRSYRAAEQVVDVNVEMNKGKQFLFGELQLEGVDEATERRLGKMWQLAGGAPMNQLYLDDYLRSLAPVIKFDYRVVGSQLKYRPDTNIVDVAIKFR